MNNDSTGTLNVNAKPQPRGRSAWHAPHLVGVSGKNYYLVRAFLILFPIAGGVLEFGFIKSIIDIVLDQAEVLSWVISLSLTALSVAIPMYAGFQFRVAKSHGEKPTFGIILIAGWIFIGTFIVALRLFGASMSAVTVSIPGANLGTGAADGQQEQVLAFLLILLFIACGLLAFAEGYSLFNIAAQGLIRTRRELERILLQIADQYGLVNRLTEGLQVARGTIADQPGALLTAQIQLASFADSLKADARHRIAWHLGDPAGTNITDLPPVTKPRTSSPLDDTAE